MPAPATTPAWPGCRSHRCRPDRKPRKPPSVMCGKKSALATPMRAVAAAYSRSATRTSGTARQHVAGVADRQGRGDRREALRRRRRCRARPGARRAARRAGIRWRWPGSAAAAAAPAPRRGGPRAGHVLLRRRRRPAGALGRCTVCLLVLDVATVSSELWRRAVEVVARDFGQQADLGVVQRGFAGAEIGAGAPPPTAHAAEQVQLPRRIEAGLVGVDGAALVAEAGLLAAAAGVVRVGVDRRQLIGLGCR